jgi:hypothetical protein
VLRAQHRLADRQRPPLQELRLRHPPQVCGRWTELGTIRRGLAAEDQPVAHSTPRKYAALSDAALVEYHAGPGLGAHQWPARRGDMLAAFAADHASSARRISASTADARHDLTSVAICRKFVATS